MTWLDASLIPLQVGCIRSWDKMVKTENTKQYTLENMDEHFLVIIDNMVSCRRRHASFSALECDAHGVLLCDELERTVRCR